MEASIVDLRYKMKSVLKALDRNEKVRILYHGKEKGIMVPVGLNSTKKVTEHPFFAMSKKMKKTVPQIMRSLRSPRYGSF